MFIHRPRAQVSVVGAQAEIRVGGEQEPYRWPPRSHFSSGYLGSRSFLRVLLANDVQEGSCDEPRANQGGCGAGR